ncbi:MAG TPA: hypothetical protein VMI75_30875 [Polyangiaceae bacterium]|nr:hypothetical protein [Polyangiaceae bacterium]
MHTRSLRIGRTWAATALFASFVGVTCAHAAATPATAPAAALPAPSLESITTPVLATTGSPDATVEIVHMAAPDEQFEGVHYRPRSSGYGRRRSDESVTQIHAGFFDPQGDASRQFVLGMRGGPLVDPHVQLGVGVDWSHITDNTSNVSHQSTGPGGTTITVQQDLSRASEDLFPIVAFAQFSGDENMSVIPYFGASGGYEVLHLSADDYQSNTSFDATYGGWGWQAWAGLGFPLSGRTRINAEAFVNTATPSRDVTDPYGVTYEERVNIDGVGMRMGVAWGF